MLPEVLPLRHASRELVRELGFLQDKEAATSLSHSHCHALIELDARGVGRAVRAACPPPARQVDHEPDRRRTSFAAAGYARAPSDDDARARVLSLTATGRAKVRARASRGQRSRRAGARDAGATTSAPPSSAAWSSTRARSSGRGGCRRYAIRPIQAGDRAAVARLIRVVMPEFGAKGPGFAINDPEVDDMFGAYQADALGLLRRHADGARDRATRSSSAAAATRRSRAATARPASCARCTSCPRCAASASASELLARVPRRAHARAGFTRMYLETLAAMSQARALYERNGFRRPRAADGRDRALRLQQLLRPGPAVVGVLGSRATTTRAARRGCEGALDA